MAGESLATPNGDEQFVLVIGSTQFNGSVSLATYAVATGAAQNAGPSTVRTGCSITSDAFASQSLPVENPPTGTAVSVGATKTIHMPLPVGSEDITVQAIAVGKTAVVWADVTQAHPANLDSTFVSQFLARSAQANTETRHITCSNAASKGTQVNQAPPAPQRYSGVKDLRV